MWSLFVGASLAAPVDRTAIAARLLADGHLDRAAAVLAEIEDPSDPDTLALIGLIAVRRGAWQEARTALIAATADPDADPSTWLALAQTHVALEDWRAALDALDQTTGLEAAGVWQLRGRALSGLGDPDAAYEILQDGAERFPDHPGLAEDQLGLLVELGLTREVLAGGADLLAVTGADVHGWVAIGDQLRRAGAVDGALVWLEDARVRFPDEIGPKLALARACLDAERPLCAGETLAEAAALDPQHADEAAECFRRAGAHDRALFWNGFVEDPATKVRQRLGLLVELGRFEQATALDARVRRLGLLTDDDVAYALAYAHWSTGDAERAAPLLSGISDPRLFRQATALREALR